MTATPTLDMLRTLDQQDKARGGKATELDSEEAAEKMADRIMRKSHVIGVDITGPDVGKMRAAILAEGGTPSEKWRVTVFPPLSP